MATAETYYTIPKTVMDNTGHSSIELKKLPLEVEISFTDSKIEKLVIPEKKQFRSSPLKGLIWESHILSTFSYVSEA